MLSVQREGVRRSPQRSLCVAARGTWHHCLCLSLLLFLLLVFFLREKKLSGNEKQPPTRPRGRIHYQERAEPATGREPMLLRCLRLRRLARALVLVLCAAARLPCGSAKRLVRFHCRPTFLLLLALDTPRRPHVAPQVATAFGGVPERKANIEAWSPLYRRAVLARQMVVCRRA